MSPLLPPPPTSSLTTENPSPDSPVSEGFPVVAVGASAGGLEAFTEFLRRLPADTGMAFVFIQHLAPGHASLLAQLLSRETAMHVNEVEDGTVLQPNQVYVIPPNTDMTISGHVLSLRPRETAGTAIDAFLRSLAANRESTAIAIILSGTGSDGALGVQAIAEEGGVVFAEDPETAKFDGMPRSAIATGCVDFILPPQGIAAEVARIAREPLLVQRDIPEASGQSPDAERDIDSVLELVHHATGVDFSQYRRTTVRRRLLRRVALLRLGSLGDYLGYLRENPDEAHALVQDILIRVTHFFRDRDAFEALSRRVFPALIRRTPQDGAVRVWVAGCSTGEEAYSIAMCFLEVAEQMQTRVSLQVFATDINEAAIEKARRGAYIENIAADVSPERLARFFVRSGKEYVVGRRLRDLCIFSRHDLLNDPPFSRMALVSCRNVLIYVDALREKALAKFHFALNPGGFLLLGKSEATSSGLFSAVDREAKLYARQDSAGEPAPARTERKKATLTPPGAAPAQPKPARRTDPRQEADRVIVQRYGPPRAIVNAALEPVTGGTESAAFQSPISGIESRDVLELVKAEADAVKKAIRTAGKTGLSIRIEPVKFGEGAALREVTLEVTPLGPERQHYLIAAEDRAVPAAAPDQERAPGKQDVRELEARVRRLEKELATSRAHLESVIIEQEAANEEVIASNEELQSLNEEMESSKEELEATNEELTTVNQELQVRNTELQHAQEFAQATIDTVRGALVALGADLRVIKANESFYKTFQLSPGDAERRFIYELAGGRWSIPRLRELLEEILAANRSMTDFEMEYDSPASGRRTLVLNASRILHEERILLAIEDVTEHRRALEELQASQKMEAVGHLAAGVAHDFNNLLTTVIGNASLVADSLSDGDPHKPALESVISGAQRAADLTRQLLAYAGKGRFYLERVDLSEAVIQTAKLVKASIPANVQLRLDLDRDLPLLLADPSQIQQVAMNLIVNAAEAMGAGGGVITVRTGLQTVTSDPLPDVWIKQDVAPGEYAFVEVQDNGSGMSDETIRKIFDPFYTTKFTGRGLGLAAAMGSVRQHKGVIQVHSVLGRGSSFRALFPTGETAQPRKAAESIPGDLRGAGTVLVVDDEEAIRNFTKLALEQNGYTALVAQGGRDAVRLVRERPGDIGLVLLDVAMPDLDGVETLRLIREIRPDMPVLICSGFGDVDVEARFTGQRVTGFFPKPYTIRQLARKVKEAMAPSEG